MLQIGVLTVSVRICKTMLFLPDFRVCVYLLCLRYITAIMTLGGLVTPCQWLSVRLGLYCLAIDMASQKSGHQDLLEHFLREFQRFPLLRPY